MKEKAFRSKTRKILTERLQFFKNTTNSVSSLCVFGQGSKFQSDDNSSEIIAEQQLLAKDELKSKSQSKGFYTQRSNRDGSSSLKPEVAERQIAL